LRIAALDATATGGAHSDDLGGETIGLQARALRNGIATLKCG
jgi:hypothetical protein